MEKGGPPIAPDGSLDYPESECILKSPSPTDILSPYLQWKTPSPCSQP